MDPKADGLFCLARERSGNAMREETKFSYKKSKVPGRTGISREGQRCLEGIWGLFDYAHSM